MLHSLVYSKLFALADDFDSVKSVAITKNKQNTIRSNPHLLEYCRFIIIYHLALAQDLLSIYSS